MKVFDISDFQPDDRVGQLVAQGAEGIILKLGETLHGTPTLDSKFIQFVNDVVAAGLPYGIYYVSHARDMAGFMEEAKFINDQVYNLLGGHEKLVLIENEFGEIGIDGGFLQDAGVEITEMNSGCICCSLVGDFGKALEKVLEQYHPDRILIEPSGVGKLSDVIRAVQNIHAHDVELDGFTTVVDAKKCKMYQKNFGEFFNNQITYASCLILSHTAGLSQEKLDDCVRRLRTCNEKAPVVTTDWAELTGKQLVEAMTQKNTLDDELQELLAEAAAHDHHHHDHDHEEHEHHHHHDHDEHDENCTCGCHDHDHEEHEHHHHHDHDENCTCGCHDHDHEHHHHHADEVFTSWGRETIHVYSEEQVGEILKSLENEEEYGDILRAKGMVKGEDGTWIYFDMVPEETEIREGSPEYTGRLCVIGSKLNEEKLVKLFGVA